MNFKLLVLGLLVTTLACSVAPPDNIGFVTRLGNDTLAVEVFEQTADGFKAQVVLRSPYTELTRYELVKTEDGGIASLSAQTLTDGTDFTGTFSETFTATKMGDSLRLSMRMGNGENRIFTTPYSPGVLPFIDMVHWPFELALINSEASGADSVNQKMLSGRFISNFIIADVGGNKRTIRHPSRGVMDVEVGADGRLMMLDAAQTTRKLVVTREQGIDINAIARRFLKLDAAGKSFGELSGAITQEFEAGGASFRVEYGAPLKRGRDLFGGIVPYGERWRTGANRATHFSTSADLMVGNLRVPAGDYTLFTIPEADGGTLIINKQTGQNGRSYDESRDLGRVPMQVRTKTDVTETFTITVTEADGGAALNLIWGNTVYFIPFEIR